MYRRKFGGNSETELASLSLEVCVIAGGGGLYSFLGAGAQRSDPLLVLGGPPLLYSEINVKVRTHGIPRITLR